MKRASSVPKTRSEAKAAADPKPKGSNAPAPAEPVAKVRKAAPVEVDADLKEALAALPAEERQEILDLLYDLRPKSPFAPVKTDTGGLADTLDLDTLLEEYNRLRGENWTPRPGRYYFSKLGQCFLKSWLLDKGTPCDCGKVADECPTHRFDPGSSEPGNAVENHFKLMMEQVYAYGREGTVLKDIRLTVPVQVQDDDGKIETIYLVGKSDPIIVGDNMRILNFTEVKTPFIWPRKKTDFALRYGRTVPLSLAKIEEPDEPSGLVNLNQIMQLAAGVHLMAQMGNPPKRATLFYIDRANYRNHLQILVTPKEAEFLQEFGIWWATEHHLNLKSEKPPAPYFFMGWECGRCPVAGSCTKLLKKLGQKREIHPAVMGINARMSSAAGDEESPT